VELSIKSKARLDKNIQSNFLKYDVQIWIIGDNDTKLARILKSVKTTYPNIKITNVSEVKSNDFFRNIKENSKSE